MVAAERARPAQALPALGLTGGGAPPPPPVRPRRFRLLVLLAGGSQAARWSSLRLRHPPGIEPINARARRWRAVARFLGTGTPRMTKPYLVMTLTVRPRLPDWGTSCALIGKCCFRLLSGGLAPLWSRPAMPAGFSIGIQASGSSHYVHMNSVFLPSFSWRQH